MKLSETSIRRPVLASMISAALVLFGVIGYTRLSVRELPDIDPPVISVSTTLPGANAQVVETAVTDVLEEELSTIQGLRTLSSSSSEENSDITLEFTLDRPVDVAAQDVRDKVSRVRGRLPVDVLEPVIAKQTGPAGPSKAFRNTLKSHMSDAQVFAKTGPDAVKEMIAPRLSCFIVNTARCLHMGSRIQSDHNRLLYTATYIQQPRIYPEPPARFRAAGALTDLERTVMRL